MKPTKKLFEALLCLSEGWVVDDVSLLPEDKRVEIVVSFTGSTVECPDCGKSCKLSDHAPERQWRHLDTMQFGTYIKSRTPRSNCSDCGVKTIKVPWAEKHSRFTLLFEDFAIEVISACSNLKSATELIGINWDTLNCIMNRAVERGLLRRTLSNIEHIGIDEKQFSSGHDYISILNDLDDGRVLDVVHGRDGDSAKDLLMKIPCELRENVTAVAADLWKAYTKACKEVLPNADIVHDKFHISKYLNEAVDKVRKQENKTLYKKGEMTLVGSKYLWLKNPKNMDEETWATFSELKDSSLKTARAWAIKENFKCIWVNFYKECAESFFDDWYNWAIRSKLAPIVNVAMMLNRHKANIMNYFKHRITNAVSEGLNSRIQTIKAAARGFHSFENFRIRILFFCGKLELHPNVSH